MSEDVGQRPSLAPAIAHHELGEKPCLQLIACLPPPLLERVYLLLVQGHTPRHLAQHQIPSAAYAPRFGFEELALTGHLA